MIEWFKSLFKKKKPAPAIEFVDLELDVGIATVSVDLDNDRTFEKTFEGSEYDYAKNQAQSYMCYLEQQSVIWVSETQCYYNTKPTRATIIGLKPKLITVKREKRV